MGGTPARAPTRGAPTYALVGAPQCGWSTSKGTHKRCPYAWPGWRARAWVVHQQGGHGDPLLRNDALSIIASPSGKLYEIGRTTRRYGKSRASAHPAANGVLHRLHPLYRLQSL